MHIDILTLFPEMFESALNFSLLKKAQEKSLVKINIINIRDFTIDKHKTADDEPYGGGAGMVIKAEPLLEAIKKAKDQAKAKAQVILLSPAGEKLNQEKVKELAKEKHLVLICGHYEGIDQRIRDKYVDQEISIGDYVLTGGELPALVIIDAVCRLIPGTVKEKESVVNDSFYQGLLDYPSYTRPDDLDGQKVPEILKSGNHKEISRWRRKEALKKTLFQRPDLLAQADLNEEDCQLIEEVILE